MTSARPRRPAGEQGTGEVAWSLVPGNVQAQALPSEGEEAGRSAVGVGRWEGVPCGGMHAETLSCLPGSGVCRPVSAQTINAVKCTHNNATVAV